MLTANLTGWSNMLNDGASTVLLGDTCSVVYGNQVSKTKACSLAALEDSGSLRKLKT